MKPSESDTRTKEGSAPARVVADFANIPRIFLSHPRPFSGDETYSAVRSRGAQVNIRGARNK